MGGFSATPDYNALLGVLWGSIYDSGGCDVGVMVAVGLASGIVSGTNPPYSASDFFDFYPAFGGSSLGLAATLDGTTAVITITGGATGGGFGTGGFGEGGFGGVGNLPPSIVVGQLVAGEGIPDGSIITAINDATITINNDTTIAGTNVQVTVYTAPMLPLGVLNAYIYLATNSVIQARYFELWPMMMANFIAHYATLWLQSQAVSPNTTAAQLAASGLAVGLATSQAAGDVSESLQYLEDLAGWGSWQLTTYGQQFATIAKALGSVGMLLY